MTLPFVPPPQQLAVDDVLPVEIIGAADDGFQDAKEHLAVEHFAPPSGAQTGLHRVVSIPIAVAQMKATGISVVEDDAFEPVFAKGFARVPKWRWGDAGRGVFVFEMDSDNWYGLEVHTRSSNGVHAYGWSRARSSFVDRQNVGYVGSIGTADDVADVTHVFIAVFGDL